MAVRANIIFLDIDGVLNCELHYRSQQFLCYRDAKKELKKAVKKGRIDRLEFYSSQICKERVGWLNLLCEETKSKVVVSSTWRMGKSVEELQEILNHCGATFEVIGKTPSFNTDAFVRGNEIKAWLNTNREYDFKDYVIIDDDSDMLLEQARHFFQTDSYCGLTPNTCYRIKRFLSIQTSK